MCDHITVLARLNHQRWISSCEHATAHLTWDSVSVRIPVARLGVIGQALLECAQVARRFRIAGTGEVCVILDQYDLYQVWFGGVGLCLSSADFDQFCQLMATACDHPATENACTPADIYPDSPIRTTYHLFSVN